MTDKTVVTIRISNSLKARLQCAADEKCGNLSAEILNRLEEHEMLRALIDAKLLNLDEVG